MDALRSPQNRFYEAFDILREKGVTNVVEFCRAARAPRTSFHHCRKAGIVRVEWLSLIVTRYGISADWLLSGRGSMLRGESNLP